jgi:hypothetical protein
MHSCKNNTGGNISHLEQMVKSFLPYSQQQLGFDKPVKIVFQSDPTNADVLLGKTAQYNPQEFEVYLYTDKRHPKDIMRSLSHEMVHHAQNCRGDFGSCGDTSPGYAQRDPQLRKMEREAYTKGNLIFRDFEDLIKTGKITIDINFKDSGEPQMSLKEWKDNELNMLLMKKWGLLKEGGAPRGEESSGHPGKSCEEAHPSDPSPAGHQDFSVSGNSYVGRSSASGLEEISYRADEKAKEDESANQKGNQKVSMEDDLDLTEWAPGFEPPGSTHDFLGNPLSSAPKGTKARSSAFYAGDSDAGGHDSGSPEHEDPGGAARRAKAAAREAWIEKNMPVELREDVDDAELEEGEAKWKAMADAPDDPTDAPTATALEKKRTKKRGEWGQKVRGGREDRAAVGKKGSRAPSIGIGGVVGENYGKISVKEAKQITRRIIERIRKEGK